MSSPHSDSYDSHTRKRVGKACDRCRLKKSKCDGSSPCSRCKLDNAICYFGERKKSHDKVYPKGYVEQLEQQQSQLVAGLRQMYSKLLDNNLWSGSALPEGPDGFPLTHDILDRLEVLHQTGENPIGAEAFEDDFEKIQQSLVDSGASYVQQQRRSTPGSDSEPELAHTDSPPPSLSRMSVSSTSSSSSRKRSSPSTPPPPTMEDLPPSSKRQKNFQPFRMPLQQQQQQSLETMPMFYQEPMVMQSPSFSEPSIDFSIYDTTELANGGFNMLDNMGPISMKAMGIQTQNAMTNFMADDPDYGFFVQSGYHGPI